MDFEHPIASLIPGARGLVLEVLANVDIPLNFRQISQLASLSPGYVARIVNELTELGVVESFENPPSVQVRLQRGNLIADDLLQINDYYGRVRSYLAHSLKTSGIEPVAALIYGSFASRTMSSSSDVDLLLVFNGRNDEQWTESLGQWVDQASTAIGNYLSVVTLTADEVKRGALRKSFWKSALAPRVELAGLKYSALLKI